MNEAFGLRHCLRLARNQCVNAQKTFAYSARNASGTGAATHYHTGGESHTIIQPAREFNSRREAIRAAPSFSSFLTDTFNRQHDYLRISITEKCNLRCQYCMPEEGVPLSPKENLLTRHEIAYLSSLFVSQGVTKIRLTGGEPTVHPDILGIVSDVGSLRSLGLKDLGITTNGVSLIRKLDHLVENGVTAINLSLDTLDPFQFEIMTRRRGFQAVMKSIDRILEMKRLGANVKLKINAVVIRDLNDAQILQFVEMTRTKDLEVRFIEYMPFDGNRWSNRKMLGYREMLETIRSVHPEIQKIHDHPNDTSKTYQVPGFVGRIGFITSMTDHFCGTCNRLRITSDGNLKVCLFGNAEVNLRDMLRKSFNEGRPIDHDAFEAMKQLDIGRRQGSLEGVLGSSSKEMELLEIIGMAVRRKREKHAGLGVLEHMKNRPMILIGSLPSLNRQLVTAPLHLLPRHFSAVHVIRSFHTISHCDRHQSSDAADTHSTSTPSITAADGLTHLNAESKVHMVTLNASKPATMRTAEAVCTLLFSNPTVPSLIRTASLAKGDVLAVARVAGIMAAKRTADLIPLCHNIPLSGCNVDISVLEPGNSGTGFDGQDHRSDASTEIGSGGGIVIRATVKTNGQTGVEMEALTAASVASLTIYDMCKAVDKAMRIEGLRVVRKEGGRTGQWIEGRQGNSGQVHDR